MISKKAIFSFYNDDLRSYSFIEYGVGLYLKQFTIV